MRKLYIKFVLFFNDVVTCEHDARGFRYCPACEDRSLRTRLDRRVAKEERLIRLRKELDGMS
jgi:hypothetical protein